MQERVASSVAESFIEHKPLDEYLINTTAFHNAHLLRRCLPRNLWAPVPLLTPEARIAKHHELAAQLRQKQPKPKHKQAQDNDEQDGDEPEDAQEAAPKSRHGNQEREWIVEAN
ncbi:hypothetical protein B0H10DRAFT_1957360 [Mycena sp. CBHHK59/15]|nr:hypothetical protein B0H10DRAFT_1957360 [Mycena sp. CBHHK59/15]